MTFKEQLDEKIKQDTTMALWEEIKNLFLNLDYTELTKDFTFRIFCGNVNAPVRYVRASNDRSVSKKFSHDYDIETLEAVASICETNGLNVERENSTSFLITYKALA